MLLLTSFYIGHQDYLDDPPNLSEDESNRELADTVSSISHTLKWVQQDEIYAVSDTNVLSANLKLSDSLIAAKGFNTETALADDQPGLPVLLYLNVFFEVPAELTELVSNLESEGELDSQVECFLQIGASSLKFMGSAEVI